MFHNGSRIYDMLHTHFLIFWYYHTFTLTTLSYLTNYCILLVIKFKKMYMADDEIYAVFKGGWGRGGGIGPQSRPTEFLDVKPYKIKWVGIEFTMWGRHCADWRGRCWLCLYHWGRKEGWWGGEEEGREELGEEERRGGRRRGNGEEEEVEWGEGRMRRRRGGCS